MGDTSGAPRNPEELATLASGVDTLLAAGLLPPDEAERQRDALKSEALAWARGLEL